MLRPRTYREESSDEKTNAQRNLSGRTHYVDDGTLKFHHARILYTRVHAAGLLFALVESVALDMRNTERGFRYAIFDICGNVLSRPSLEDCFKTSEQARKSMYAALNQIDAIAVSRAAIAEMERQAHNEATQAYKMISDIEAGMKAGQAERAALK